MKGNIHMKIARTTNFTGMSFGRKDKSSKSYKKLIGKVVRRNLNKLAHI